MKKQSAFKVYSCADWDDVREALTGARKDLKAQNGEELWFRGVSAPSCSLLPTLFWRFSHRTGDEIDAIEHDLFFEFQARARELHERGLSDWDYLFFMRHHGVPTRILDWTDSFGIAVYFATEAAALGEAHAPCIWVLNPYALNEVAWEERDLVQPKWVGYVEGDDDDDDDGELWDYSELLLGSGPWNHDEPVALYPLQISDRMRAQRGWFTMFGNNKESLEAQVPDAVARIDLTDGAIPAAREFLSMAGLRPYTIYPDLDHLAAELVAGHLDGRRPPVKGEALPTRCPIRKRRKKKT